LDLEENMREVLGQMDLELI
jgi:hypothetical protein